MLITEDAREGSFLRQDELQCLIHLLNESLLSEVCEERVISKLCCNFATCKEPQMTDEVAE